MYYAGRHSDEIKESFSFLFDRGYSFRVINEHKVAFFSQKCTLSIYSEQYEDGFSVDIDFSEEFPAKESYSVDLIKRVAEEDYEKHDMPVDDEYLNQISQFVNKNIEKLEDQKYCKSMYVDVQGMLKKWAKENFGDLDGIVFDE